MAYQELKEDQHILIYIPQKSFYPGSKFRVPVKLQAESDLQTFVIKLKTRHGISVIGAEAADTTRWRISINLNHKNRGAMVTAFVADREKYTKTDRIQDVFEWIFEVEEGAMDDDRGRMKMVLEYEMNTQFKEKYGTVENQVVSRVQIQRDNTYSIVPVIKATEIINTAILTGKIQNFAMRVFSVSQAGKIGDITSQTTCHSGDDEVLKVAQSCNLVYLDGSETRGSPSVSVIAKYGRHTKFLFFQVWVPEMPLEIEMSDTKLSQIRRWKAPKHLRRKERGVDFGVLTHPGLMLKEEGIRKEEFATTCHLRFQQSVVEVYARFLIPDSAKHEFLVHRKAFYRVTDLVKDRLRIADTNIAALSGNMVQGLRTGRTEIQVLSRMGRVIGASEVKVANNKVNIERLEVDVVTGLEMELMSEPEMPGTLAAKIMTTSQLKRKYQEGVLQVSIKFDDGTSMPLKYISPSDYFLDMDTLNNHVVAFGAMLGSDTPRVIALGRGKGELLKLALELGDQCQRKKSRPLAVSYVYIDVDFAEDPSKASAGEDKSLQADAGHYGYGGDGAFGGKGGEGQGHQDKKWKGARGPTDEDTPHEDYNDVMMTSHDDPHPNHEAQQQHIVAAQGMTPLEIGMYILLAVFCLAIVVFMLNCMIFVVRYRRKHPPKHARHGPVAQVDDWVWIGRETLERNAINTTCQQALMPEADFNGNHGNNTTNGGGGDVDVSSDGNHGNQGGAVEKLGTLSNHGNGGTTSNHGNRGSGCSGGNRNSGGGGGGSTSNRNSGGGGGGGVTSNRNSMISTYKGSECSIRITANPLLGGDEGDSEDVITEEDSASLSGRSTSHTPRDTPRDTPVHHHHSMPRPTHKLGRSSLGTRPKSLPRNLTPRPDSAILARQEALKQEFLKQQADGATSGSELEFDYEAMGMTYQQLMEYFDNLKESTA